MIFDNIYGEVVNSFGLLWKYKERGNSLEIITPFATTSHKFISVFLTKRNDAFIVSDGGWINDGIYENSFDRTIGCYGKIIEHYKNSFDVKEVANNNEKAVFYKKTSNEISVPSLILDMSNFVSSLVSLSNVPYLEQEKENKERFRRNATEFLQSIIPAGNLMLNRYVDEHRQIRVNAIVMKQNRMTLVNYITGSNYDYFNSSISKTNLIYELANKTKESVYIDKKIVLLDDAAQGFVPNKIGNWLDHLLVNTHTEKVSWSTKNELQSLLN